MNPFTLRWLWSSQIVSAMNPPWRLYPIAPNLVQFAPCLKLFGLLILSCIFGSSIRFSRASSLLFIIPFILFPLLGGLPSALRAIRISRTIATERERGTHDLLSLTGLGAYGLHWWIARSVGGINKIQLGNNLSAVVQLILILLGIYLGSLLLYSLFSSPISTTTYLLSIIFVIMVYFKQNTAAAFLIGMIVPSYINKRFEAQFWAIAAFVLFQVATIGLLILLVDDHSREVR